MRQTAESPIDVKTRSSSEFMTDYSVSNFILKNKAFFIGAVVALLLGVVLWGFVTNHLKARKEASAELITAFTEGDLKGFAEKKIDENAILTAFNSLRINAKGTKALAPVAISLADQLLALGKSELALQVLLDTEKSLGTKDQFLNYLFGVRLAAIYEDLAQTDEAIKRLELIVSSKVKLVEAKTYLDLGRLYLLKGDKVSANKNLQYVIDNYAGEDLARVAKLYMEKTK